MTDFTIAGCLLTDLVRVQAEQRYRDTIGEGDTSRVFAVFEANQYLGLVTERQAALFPGRIFADLMVMRQPDPIPQDASLDQALERMQDSNIDYLPVMDDQDRFVGAVSQASLFAALSEIEGRLRLEREDLIRRIEAELRDHRIAAAVFDSTSEGILVTDADNNIILINEAFTKTTGYSLEEVKGKRSDLLHSGRHDQNFFANMWRTLRETGEWSGEIWNRRKDGEIYPEWLNMNVVYNTGGQISHYVFLFSDLFNQKHIQRHLHQLAYYDALTGLPNRQLFYDRLGQAILQASRDNLEFALIFLDFDGFKDVNDSLGHGFGDRLLQAAACRLKEIVSENDTVARIGGDEFTVLLQSSEKQEDPSSVATRIIESFSRPFEVEKHRIFLTASIGIARYPQDGQDVDTLVKNADTAMYQAKEEGRNRYRFFTSQLNIEVSERLYLENSLRSSLQEGGLYLMWQPQVRLSDGGIVGLEALSRWRHPKLGEIPPSRFIPLAEKAGLMQALGSWALEAVAVDIANLSGIKKGLPLRFAVNFSAVQFYDGDTLKKNILDTLDRAELEPDQLVLEVTESIFMSRGHSVDAVLAELGSWGLQIAIDDFGTGYSNLAYLKRFAVHHIKVDQSFTRDLVEDATSRQLVTAIVQMAHSLNIKVIAEGVETQEQRDILFDLGCDEGQGYLFGRPMELSRLLEENRLTRNQVPDLC